jgi:hypothetical protein
MTRRAPLLLLAVATVTVVLLASYRVNDTDFWQHLTIGREIWRTHRIPLTHQWTWASPPLPDLNYAWGFQALLWPFYAGLGAAGMIVWKWWTALIPFALALATARRLGASYAAAAPVAVLAAIAARDRMEPRPETLAAILLALFVWILEVRRQGGRNRTWLLPLLSLAWANVHNTWFLGLAVLGVHALVASFTPRTPGRGAARLWLILLACIAVSFVNPWGWHTLWQPIGFALQGRDQVMFRAIVELQPSWSTLRWQELEPIALVAWPLLAIVRALRGRRDPVELVLLVLLSALAWNARRFIGAYAIVMAPYLARDAGEWLGERSHESARAAAAAAILCIALAISTLVRSEAPLGFGINRQVEWPGLVDYLQRQAPARRLFNQFELGGYLLWRMYPERKPFVDTHQTVPRRDLLDLYFNASVNQPSWQRLDDEFQFDAVALDRHVFCDSLVAFLDRDPRWARVHQDEGSILYLKRGQGWDAQIARDAMPSSGNPGEAVPTR